MIGHPRFSVSDAKETAGSGVGKRRGPEVDDGEADPGQAASGDGSARNGVVVLEAVDTGVLNELQGVCDLFEKQVLALQGLEAEFAEVVLAKRLDLGAHVRQLGASTRASA